jgi:hypothetical protein
VKIRWNSKENAFFFSSTVKAEAVRSSETLVTTHKTARRHIREDHNRQLSLPHFTFAELLSHVTAHQLRNSDVISVFSAR